MAANELEKTANNLLAELSSCRALALKNDTRVLVRFSTTTCTLFIDTSNNSIGESGEIYKIYLIKPNTISFGIASGGPTSGPPDVSFSSSGIAGAWTNYMIVESDATGSINTGAIYLNSSKLDRHTYCIGKATTSQFIKLYKWAGSSWLTL